MKERLVEEQVEDLLLAIEIDEGIVHAISHLGEPARAHLLELLELQQRESRPELAKRAALVSGALGLKDAASKLEEWALLPDASLAMSGLHALARASVPSVCRAAVAVLKSPTSPASVKGHALVLLDMVGDEDVLNELQAWRRGNIVPELDRIAETVSANLKRHLTL